MSADEILKKIDAIPEYTENQWKEEMDKIPNTPHQLLPFLMLTYSSALTCPVCQTIGFYGPKIAGERKYRACKFCGFWQEAPGESQKTLGPKGYRCIHIYCPNKHEYDWVHPPINDFRNCNKCQTKLIKTDWASDNPNHAFQNIKTQIAELLSK